MTRTQPRHEADRELEQRAKLRRSLGELAARSQTSQWRQGAVGFVSVCRVPTSARSARADAGRSQRRDEDDRSRTVRKGGRRLNVTERSPTGADTPMMGVG
jgi:hypothetical protein